MDRKTAAYFRECPAKRGHGAERKALLTELLAEENMHCHMIIMTMTGMSREGRPEYQPPQEWLDKRAACEKRLAELEEALSKIVGEPKPRLM
jgi:hypothetical protein